MVGFRIGHLSLQFESLMHPLPVVVILEQAPFSFEVPYVPKRRLVEILASDCPDQTLHERV